MPELPEIENIKKDLTFFCINKTITNIKIYNKKLKYTIPSNIKKIKNKKILNIKRYSKYIIIYINDIILLIHLGMTGNILIYNKYYKPTKHDHIDFFLNNNIIIRYFDVRKFGYILLITYKKIKKIISKLGPEPLSKKFNSKYLFKIIKKKKICIHQILINQKIISGIGNIYANECLFKAKIKPYRISNTINFIECINIVKSIKLILKYSILLKGTLKINTNCINNNGLYFKKLMVYKKNKKKCKICNKLIISIKKYGRSLYYCNLCQK